MLFHDWLEKAIDERCRDREPAFGAVERLLEATAGRYRWVTVPELLRLGRWRRSHWYRRPDLEWLRRER